MEAAFLRPVHETEFKGATFETVRGYLARKKTEYGPSDPIPSCRMVQLAIAANMLRNNRLPSPAKQITKGVRIMEKQEIKETNLPEVATVKTKELVLSGGILPRDLDELTRYASLIQKSKLAPKSFDTLEKVAIGILMNMELGRPIIVGLQDLAIINGKCGIYGDASLAMVTASGLMEDGYPISKETGTPYTDDWTFKYTVKRVGRPEETGVWTWLDSKRAGFDAPKTKDGRDDIWSPWTRFTRRMMQWKSRNFVIRDNFGDVLKGMKTVEDHHDLDAIPLEQQPDGSYSEDQTAGAGDLTDKIKENEKADKVVDAEFDTAPCPYCQKDIQGEIDLVREGGKEVFMCPHCGKIGKVEDGKPVGSFPPDHTARNSEDFKEAEAPCPYCQKDIKDEVERIVKFNGTSFACPHCHKQGRIVDGKPVGEFLCGYKGCKFKGTSEAGLKRHKTQQGHHEKPAEEEGESPTVDEKRKAMVETARRTLINQLGEMPRDVVMKAKIDLGKTRPIESLNLEELEALAKRVKEISTDLKTTPENAPEPEAVREVEPEAEPEEAPEPDGNIISMIDAIEADYKPEEIAEALSTKGHEMLASCDFSTLCEIHDVLRGVETTEENLT